VVCRQYLLSSVALALARADSGLDAAQVQSVFHQLRHELAGLGEEARDLYGSPLGLGMVASHLSTTVERDRTGSSTNAGPGCCADSGTPPRARPAR